MTKKCPTCKRPMPASSRTAAYQREYMREYRKGKRRRKPVEPVETEKIEKGQ